MTIQKRFKTPTIALAISLIALTLFSVFKIFSPHSNVVRGLQLIGILAAIGSVIYFFITVVKKPEQTAH